MRLLLDINILLDVLLVRSGAITSGRIMDLCEQKLEDGWVAWHTLPTVYYYYSKGRTRQDSWLMMNQLLSFLQVPTTGTAEVRNVFSYQVNDFEDALQVSAAEACFADRIITRNVNDYRNAPLPCLTPEAFLGGI